MMRTYCVFGLYIVTATAFLVGMAFKIKCDRLTYQNSDHSTTAAKETAVGNLRDNGNQERQSRWSRFPSARVESNKGSNERKGGLSWHEGNPDAVNRMAEFVTKRELGRLLGGHEYSDEVRWEFQRLLQENSLDLLRLESIQKTVVTPALEKSFDTSLDRLHNNISIALTPEIADLVREEFRIGEIRAVVEEVAMASLLSDVEFTRKNASELLFALRESVAESGKGRVTWADLNLDMAHAAAARILNPLQMAVFMAEVNGRLLAARPKR